MATALNEDKKQALESLRSTIAGIERKPLLADSHKSLDDRSSPDGRMLVPSGVLQELHASSTSNLPTADGLAFAMARGMTTPTRKAIMHLQLLQDDHEIGMPYGPGVIRMGLDLDHVVMVRTRKIEDLLWAAEEAAACKAVAAVVMVGCKAHKALDFTATRRLSMRAADKGCGIMLVSSGKPLPASAASLRWDIAPAPSSVPEFDDRGVGAPRWNLVLRKGRLQGVPEQSSMIVELRDEGLAFVRSVDLAPAGTEITSWGRQASSGR